MWEVGRSANPKAPYFKWLLFISRKLKMDAYILRYPPGSKIDFHTDPAPKGYSHFRLNIVIKTAKSGGEFITRSPYVLVEPTFVERQRWNGGPAKWTHRKTEYRQEIHKGIVNFFRPDLQEHAVAEVKQGTRYVLSIGWLTKDK